MSSIVPLLGATRSSDKTTRSQAEDQIVQYLSSNTDEFLLALLSIAANPHSDISDAQSALMILKTSVNKYWSPGFEQFTGPPFSHETRELVRKGLMDLLSVSENSRTRSACASVVSRIASMEYPDQWPDVVQQCIQMLEDPSNSPRILSGLVLFRELLLETVREEDFMNYGDNVMSLLHNIALQVTGDERRLLSLQCFHECITFLLMGDDDQMPRLNEMAQNFIPAWVQLFNQIIQEPSTFRDAEMVKIVVASIDELDSAFPAVLKPSLPEIFAVVNNVLQLHMGEFPRTADNDDIISELSSLLMAILQHGEQLSHFDTPAKFAIFGDLLINMATVPGDIAELWVEDFNVFVTADLSLDIGDYGSRENAASLVGMVNSPYILTHLLDELVKSGTNKALKEAILFLLSSLISQLNVSKFLPSVGTEKMQVLLNALGYEEPDGDNLEDKMTPSPHSVLLIARKALTAAAVAKQGASYLPEGIRAELSLHPFKAPYSDSEVVRVSQMQAAVTGSSLYPSHFLPFQTDIIKLIASLIEDADDDTPGLLTESFGSILKLNYAIAAGNPEVIGMIFTLANKDTSDVELNAQILEVVEEILENYPHREIVGEIMRPVLATIAKGEATRFEFSGDLSFALDLATSVFEHKKVQLSGDEREQMLNSFYGVITETEDPQILQAASFAYAALVQNINGGISNEAAQNVLKVAAKLLDPSLSDSAALASGKLVIAIIDQFSSELGESILAEIVDACAKRLSTAKNALLVETLVMVFCNLTLRNASAVVNMLATSGMLDPVMKQWIPTFEVVRGSDEIYKNVKALQLLFDLHDPRLQALPMPDAPIRKPNEILTRRRAKNLQFTQIPLPLKILKLLAKELAQSPEPPTNGAPPSKKPAPVDDSDDDWDDEFALNDEGDELDFRMRGLLVNWFRKLAHEEKSVEWLNQLGKSEQEMIHELTAE